jgi:DtxR family transcriptional regulator, Mn-dependent transcriptional regulator
LEDIHKITVREVEYLLTIFKKSRETGYTRNKQVVEELRVSKSTASLMIKKLRNTGLVSGSSRKLKLTSKAEEILTEKLWKHGVIENALHYLGIPLEESCRISWRIEPLLSRKDVEYIWRRLNEPQKCPCGMKIPDMKNTRPLSEYDFCRI